jgi:hypothetical protein
MTFLESCVGSKALIFCAFFSALIFCSFFRALSNPFFLFDVSSLHGPFLFMCCCLECLFAFVTSRLFRQLLRTRLAVSVQIRNHRYKKYLTACLWFCVMLASFAHVAVFRCLSPRILASSTAGIFERMIPKIITVFRYRMRVTFILVMRLDPKQTPIEQTEFFDDLVR